jgi:hypothetical protein
VLNEDADFGGHPATGGPHGKDRDNSTFSEFCGEEPCWRLRDPQMFEDTHPHLFDIAGSEHSFGITRFAIDALGKHFDQEQIVGLVATIATANLTNRINEGVKTPVDV